MLELAKIYFKLVFILSDEKIDELPFKRKFMWFSDYIPELSDDENLKLWRKHMFEIKEMTEETPEDIANKFKFTPIQIEGAVHDAKMAYAKEDDLKLDKKQFARCAYSQSMSRLGDMARLITEPYTWDDIVLNEKTKEKIKDGCKRIKHQRKVRDVWEVKTRKGLSMLFYGSSGVGKTMAAQVFANDINMDIYQVDSSKIISKYIGETDKNLKAIFDEARKSNVVLLFDEADAIFAKRTEIKDSHDKNANTTASFLLQMLDTYPGIMILTTNFKGNIDEAFERRFTIKVGFENFVTTKNRVDQIDILKLKQNLFVTYFEKTRLLLNKNIDWSFLITQFNITGGEMRNIAETAAYEAADENAETIEMKHILKAIRNELPPTMVDLGRYENLMKN